MDTEVIVLVADRDDPKHGEITVLNNTTEAERLVETLLEAGFGQERIRIFAGAGIDAQVSHRPVVVLPVEDVLRPDIACPSPAEDEDELPETHVEAGAEADEMVTEDVPSSPFRSLGAPPISHLAG